MKTNANRPWRKTHAWPALLLFVAVLAVCAASAQASTGGASTVADSGTSAGSEIAFSPMQWAGATWYGPGLYGRHTACGQILGPETIGVAHRSLPCGTMVKFTYRGHTLVTQVIDRGPYSRGNAWDLTQAAARALQFEKSGADRLRFAVSLEYAGSWRQARRSGP
jgi:rare lipoprotein A (peptidoglycan hydrolase)